MAAARTATSSPWQVEPPVGGKVLLLLRHAKSDWDTGEPDHERPLNQRGRCDARAVGSVLIEHDLVPDVVACSTALRTRQTWEGATTAGAHAGEVRHLDDIYLAEVDALVQVVRELPEAATTAMLIGHSPGVPGLVEFLGARSEASPAWTALDEGYPTAGLVVLTLPGSWRAADRGAATLLAFEVPRGSARN